MHRRMHRLTPGSSASAGALALKPRLQQLLSQPTQLLVFVRYERSDDLPNCQAAFLANLASQGWCIWIVDNSDTPLSTTWQERSGCSLYWQRQNSGMCVGAYADAVALLNSALDETTTLITPAKLALVNNSFFPLLAPSDNPLLHDLFSRPLPATHFRGLTESREQSYHLQSYILILGSDGWRGVSAARNFWQSCQTLGQRMEVISEGEVALTGILQSAGLQAEVILPLSQLAALEQTRIGVQAHHPVSPIEHNPYLVYWKELLQLTGIIKKSALNNASQSITADATLADFIAIARQAQLPGAEAVIDRLVRH